MTQITGHNFIGGQRSAAGTVQLHSVDATTGEALPYQFIQATEQEVDAAAMAASAAYPLFRSLAAARRAEFLEAIAEEIDALGDDFVAIVCRETALPAGRIQGERGRTSGQMRLFANVLRRGDFYGARIDQALPERKPLPRVDLRQYRIGVGPVAVFGASNFPLAFSTAGGDTAAALAAGCPVVFKAHSGHMATAEQVALAIQRAGERTGMPAGVFNMIYGAGVGATLVKHPAIQAVGFTGSLSGGRALCDMAAARPQPIPVFAEMSSINPVLVLPDALSERGQQIAQELGASVMLGAGQFCTSPGLVLGIRSPAFSGFVDALGQFFNAQPAQTLLNAGGLRSYAQGLSRLAAQPADLHAYAEVVPLLEHKAGRLLLNGYPTGVEVCDAMVHGGPYPATSDARGTSVGSLAIDRFLRPVCFQNYPDSLLPDALKDANPLGIPRLVNGLPCQRASGSMPG